jgi:alkanesulfonate monooxygenase SsuD/methylene tetrahydromethanopterin reductase-like flavin-dependent oxidoreductase (luciferase family)
MLYALSLPNFDEHWHPRTLARLAREAEEAGWDGFFIWDHMLFNPYKGLAISDPWVALAAIALNTERIRIGPMVTPLPRRRPWKLAREVVSIDHLSNGRLILGVGLGAPAHEEFEFLGEESNDKVRAAKLDEGLDVLTGLLSGQKFGYQGAHYQIEETVFLPQPVQRPRVPIWVAATWPHKRPLRRAARWDGIFAIQDSAQFTPAMLQETVAYIQQYRESDAPFAVVAIGATPGDDPARGAEIVASYAEVGANWWIEDVSMWRFKAWNSWLEPYEWPTEEIERRIRQGPPKR